MKSIGIIQSQYRQRFGIPRQPGLSPSATATIRLDSHFTEDSVEGLHEFSHIWVIFHFHDTKGKGWKEKVRPPRLGGNEKRGVFATRSPFRPNPVGLSVVELGGIYTKDEQVHIDVVGGDFLDQTPVFDIKPYVPYADSLPTAKSQWAQSEDTRLPISPELGQALEQLTPKQQQLFQKQKAFIEENLSLDPRPPYLRNKDAKPGQSWGVMLGDFDIRFTIEDGTVLILQCTYLQEKTLSGIQGSGKY